NARKRRDEVVALGFPARMAERVETTPSYWLDVVVGDDAKVNWQARARAPKIQARSTGCFQ
ncbi:MAG TPA: SPOR domain-containing protein, partial [Pinirhizobacter sp.]|nr:SPOR domain-containing protein [Pinirhizobacter sp.]